MKDSTRARVAASVVAASKKASVGGVYDHQTGQQRQASASFSGDIVQGYDYESGLHFGGGSGGALDFFDYETGAQVQLKLQDDKFSGFDYHTNSLFSGTVRNGSVSLYDCETGQHYSFSG